MCTASRKRGVSRERLQGSDEGDVAVSMRIERVAAGGTMFDVLVVHAVERVRLLGRWPSRTLASLVLGLCGLGAFKDHATGLETEYMNVEAGITRI